MRNDPIRDIIASFTENDKKQFHIFINRQRNRSFRKDEELFNILSENIEYSSSDIIKQLYGQNENKNAYQSVRKRLINHLIDFISMKRISEDTTNESKVMGLLSTARFLLEKGRNAAGWNFLRRAEKLAHKSELYALLNNVLHSQIQYANLSIAPDLNTLLKTKSKYASLHDQNIRIEIASMRIKLKLKSVKKDSTGESIEILVRKTLDKYDLNEVIYNNPKVFYEFMSIIRSAIITTKAYNYFEKIIVGRYENLKEKCGFQKRDHTYKLSILYMVSHVLYRNRNFDLCQKYIQELEDSIFEYSKSHLSIFYPKLLLIKANVLSYQGFNDQSIEIIEDALKNHKDSIVKTDVINMKLNLAVYYFQKENFVKCNIVLFSIQYNIKSLVEKMGMEWVIRKELIEILTHFELDNFEIVLTRVRGFKRTYAEILKKEIYSRVRTFIGFIEDCVKNPEWISSEKYFNHVDKTLERWPVESEDIQAMAFYCWLKSKMEKRPYYKVLVETVNDLSSRLRSRA